MQSRTILLWLGLLFGIAGLILQLAISLPAMLDNGRDLPGALGHFFAYYTILTNVVVVLIYLSELLPTERLALFRHPVLRGMMAACVALVSIYVFLVLRHLTTLTGLFDLADRILHYLCPTLFLMWWFLAQKHGQLRFANLPVMLVPTLVYFAYVMARGAWVQEYPYPILDMRELGYPQVLFNAVYMTVGLALLSMIVIALDGLLAPKSRTVQ